MVPAEIKKAIHEVLDERDSIDREAHHAHHEFVSRMIEKERKRTERREKVTQQVTGWAIITFITGVGYAAWVGYQAITKKLGH